MASNEDEGRGAAKAFSKIADKGADAAGHALSSLGEGSVHLYEDFNLNVFKDHLDQLVKNQSVVNAIDVKEVFASTCAFQASIAPTRSSLHSSSDLHATKVNLLDMLSEVEKNFYKRTYEPDKETLLLELDIQKGRLEKIQQAIRQGLDSVPSTPLPTEYSNPKSKYILSDIEQK